mgnify:CR=1 FL=1
MTLSKTAHRKGWLTTRGKTIASSTFFCRRSTTSPGCECWFWTTSLIAKSSHCFQLSGSVSLSTQSQPLLCHRHEARQYRLFDFVSAFNEGFWCATFGVETVYVYVCLCVRLCVFVRACVRACVRASMCISLSMCVYVCAFLCVCMFEYFPQSIHMRMFVFECACMRAKVRPPLNTPSDALCSLCA